MISSDARIEQLEARLCTITKERDALRARIEAMERQEPVARTVGCVTEWVSNGDGTYSLGGCLEAFAPLPDDAQLYAHPGAQPAPSALAEAIIADMQAQHDSELITENDSGEALIRLDGAIAAVEDNFALAQPAQKAVAYLDLSASGYMDLGTDLNDEQLASLPKGRHMLGIVGTYGVDGYVSAQPAPSVPDSLPVYADPFTYVIQHLNSNPYSLTKDECVTLIKELRDLYNADTEAKP